MIHFISGIVILITAVISIIMLKKTGDYYHQENPLRPLYLLFLQFIFFIVLLVMINDLIVLLTK